MDWPGYQLSAFFNLEIPLANRDDKEKVIIAFDSFPLAEFTSVGPEIVWGPGKPPVKYPGRTEFNDFSIEFTVFPDDELLAFFRVWRENCVDDYATYVKDCSLVGLDIDGNATSEAKLRGVWPTTVSEGARDRTTNRQRATVILAVREIEYPSDVDYSGST